MTRRRAVPPSRAAAPPAARARRGMTLVEVMIALVILVGVLVGMCEYMGRFARQINVVAVEATAADLATSRLEALKGITRYDRLDDFAATESALPAAPGYTRVTTVQRTTTTQVDYRTVTVSVAHPSLGAPVRKTTVIARF